MATPATRINLLIAIAVVIAAIAFVIAYSLETRRASRISRKEIYIEVTFLIGSIFFFIYAGLSLYQEIRYPQRYKAPL